MEIINLDTAVINAVNFFVKNKPVSLDLTKYNFPFVVGSGNAYNTGLIIFGDRPAIFADESNFKKTVEAYGVLLKKKVISQAVIISASGEKDSVWEVELAKSRGLETTLLTCSSSSSAAKIADKVFVYRKLPEPYTYNTSTYMGMIMSSTSEEAGPILKLINDLVFPKNFDQYKSYSFVLPDKYLNLCPMLDIKKSELFGPHLSLRAFTQGYARHAKFVNPWPEELVISIGVDNQYYGKKDHRWHIPLPKVADYGAMMALTYYIVGKIQSVKPAYFKENIEAYCQDYGPAAYGKKGTFEVIVPGN